MKIIAFLPKPCGFQNRSYAVFDNLIELFLNIYLFFFCHTNRRFSSSGKSLFTILNLLRRHKDTKKGVTNIFLITPFYSIRAN